jgi:putative ABC transport system ATP-binding protein
MPGRAVPGDRRADGGAGGAARPHAVSGPALLRAALRAHPWRVGAAAALLGAHQAFEALVPVTVGATLDAAVEHSDSGALVRWLAALAVLFALLSAAYRHGARAGVAATELVAHDLRMRLVARVLDPRGGGEGGRLPGELLSVATADVDAVAAIVRVVAFGAGVAVALAAGAVVLLLTSVQLGLLVLVGLPAALWLQRRLTAPLARRAAEQQARAADAAGVATDLAGGLRVLQGIGGVDAGVARYRRASRASLHATLGAARAEAVFEAGAMLVAGVALAAVGLVGGRLAAAGEISIGQLIAAVGVTQFLVGPLVRLAWVGAMLARARGSAGRLASALAAPPAVAAPAQPAAAPYGPAALAVRALRHGPLDGLDLDVEPGTVHGIVVPDPAAAAALLDALGREEEPAAGSVAVGGVPAAALEPAAARRAILVSPHEPALLADTVAANIGAAGAEADAVERALGAAAVDDVIAALPDGPGSRLSDGGRSLSGGQRQRVALARALAAPAGVLVLHEPTTALDAATEARVAGALRTVRPGATIVLITTSPALLAACDVVTIVRDGRATGAGRHAELLDADAGYREAVLA